jgi:hypothetical protein
VRLNLHHANDAVDANLLVEDEQLAEEVNLLRCGEESVRIDSCELGVQFLLPFELFELVLFLKLARTFHLITGQRKCQRMSAAKALGCAKS